MIFIYISISILSILAFEANANELCNKYKNDYDKIITCYEQDSTGDLKKTEITINEYCNKLIHEQKKIQCFVVDHKTQLVSEKSPEGKSDQRLIAPTEPPPHPVTTYETSAVQPVYNVKLRDMEAKSGPNEIHNKSQPTGGGTPARSKGDTADKHIQSSFTSDHAVDIIEWTEQQREIYGEAWDNVPQFNPQDMPIPPASTHTYTGRIWTEQQKENSGGAWDNVPQFNPQDMPIPPASTHTYININSMH